MMEILGGRKTAICLLAIVICCAAVLIKGDIPAGLQEMLKYIVATFLAGNIGADVVAAVNNKTSSAAMPDVVAPTDLSPVLASLNQLGQGIQVIAETSKVNQQGISYLVERAPQPGNANRGF